MENWFYMNQMECSAADLKEAAAGIDGIQIDLWREANVLELTLKNGVIDFEPMRPYFKDKADDEFLKKNNGPKPKTTKTAEKE